MHAESYRSSRRSIARHLRRFEAVLVLRTERTRRSRECGTLRICRPTPDAGRVHAEEPLSLSFSPSLLLALFLHSFPLLTIQLDSPDRLASTPNTTSAHRLAMPSTLKVSLAVIGNLSYPSPTVAWLTGRLHTKAIAMHAPPCVTTQCFAGRFGFSRGGA